MMASLRSILFYLTTVTQTNKIVAQSWADSGPQLFPPKDGCDSSALSSGLHSHPCPVIASFLRDLLQLRGHHAGYSCLALDHPLKVSKGNRDRVRQIYILHCTIVCPVPHTVASEGLWQLHGNQLGDLKKKKIN